MTCAELLLQLNQLDEHPRIEAKTASDLGKSALQTICGFSNEPGLGGGYLLLGVQRIPDQIERQYRAAGVPDPDKLQADLASKCASVFNVVVRPEVWSEVVDGQVLVGVFVPEAQAGDKPVFFSAQGLPRGAYRRIGSSDQRCTDEDLLVFYQGGSITHTMSPPSRMSGWRTWTLMPSASTGVSGHGPTRPPRSCSGPTSTFSLASGAWFGTKGG